MTTEETRSPAAVQRAAGPGPRTRGGWTPSGTAASRRDSHYARGTDRGERTRRQLIDAARRVFERNGYLDVGVDDIVKEAGVARGSFYTYFPSKADVFRVVASEVAEAVDHSIRGAASNGPSTDPVTALCEANERYVSAFEQNAQMYQLIEQVGHVDEELHASWRSRGRKNADRIARLIANWQARGVADPTVDAQSVAIALLLMTTSTCRWMYVGADERPDLERTTAALNEIWVRAVDLRRRPNPRWLAP